MSLFAVICRDAPGKLQTRMDTRERHLAFLGETAGLVMAGPFLHEGAPCGSLLIVEAETLADVADWAARDPYAQAGLFASVEISEWKKVIG